MQVNTNLTHFNCQNNIISEYQMTEAELLKIKKNLKPGDHIDIAKRSKCSTSNVYKVLDGRRNNDSVILNAQKVAMENIKKEKEIKIKITEIDRLKSIFLATISHELRTPLNAIIGFSEIINKNTGINEIMEYVGFINKSGKKLLNIIENILSLSLFEEEGVKIKKQTFRLSDLFIETKSIITNLINESEKCHLDFIFKPQIEIADKYINSDRFKILQVLVHLFKNAIKFTKQGYVEFGFYEVKKKDIIFYVSDTGIGIPEKMQNLIFDFFRQVDDANTRVYGGIGIGLSISKSIINALGGGVEVESIEGKGSTFKIILKDVFEPYQFEDKISID
jgi:signal transduction histidine kinase